MKTKTFLEAEKLARALAVARGDDVHPSRRRGWVLVRRDVNEDGVVTFEAWENRELLDQLEMQRKAREEESARIKAWAEAAAAGREHERLHPTVVCCSCPFACFVHGPSVPWGLGPC